MYTAELWLEPSFLTKSRSFHYSFLPSFRDQLWTTGWNHSVFDLLSKVKLSSCRQEPDGMSGTWTLNSDWPGGFITNFLWDLEQVTSPVWVSVFCVFKSMTIAYLPLWAPVTEEMMSIISHFQCSCPFTLPGTPHFLSCPCTLYSLFPVSRMSSFLPATLSCQIPPPLRST